jgi:hypothetical protein
MAELKSFWDVSAFVICYQLWHEICYMQELCQWLQSFSEVAVNLICFVR